MRGVFAITLSAVTWSAATAGVVSTVGAGASGELSGLGIPVSVSIGSDVSPAGRPLQSPARSLYGAETGLPLGDGGAPGGITFPPVELPAPPSSVVLGLSALAGLGVVQAGRTIRKAQFAGFPDWYHEHAGPVGHSTPLVLERVVLPVCMFEPLIDLTAALLNWWVADRDVGPPPRLMPVTATPRGPPLLALS